MAKRRGLRPPTSKQLVIPRLDESGQAVYEEAHGPIKPSDSIEGLAEFNDADRPIPTTEQAQQLQQWTAKKRWISKENAFKWFEEQCATWVEAPYITCTPSRGYAQELLARARASRQVHYTNFRVDGVIFPKDGMPDPDPQFDLVFNLDDLVGWRDRHMVRIDPAPAAAVPTPAPAPGPQGKRKYATPQQDRAKKAFAVKWPDGRLPDRTIWLDGPFCTEVIETMKAECKNLSVKFVPISNRVILRTAGRAK